MKSRVSAILRCPLYNASLYGDPTGYIGKLFDSLMQGYPFGTFLYWIVAPANSSTEYRFYDFVLELS